MISLPQRAKASHQISQGRRGEQHGRALVGLRVVLRRCQRQVCPGPGQGLHHPVVESHQHTRDGVTPKHAADPTPLTAGRTLFRDDREGGATECNVRCSLSLG